MNQPKLAVFFDAMPESNGKRNWTVMVHREEDNIFESIAVKRTEYYDRARYEYDSWRYMLGMIEERPNLLEYDPDLMCPPGHKLENFDGTFPDLPEAYAGEVFWADDDSPSDLDMIPVDGTRCHGHGVCHVDEFPPDGCESPTLCSDRMHCARY